MKKKILAALLSLCIIMMPSTVYAAGIGQDVPQQAASEAQYEAPAYGTKARSPEKEAAYAQIRELTAALQGQADAAAPFTYSHNVSVDNYSDVNALGLVYESKGSGVILAMDGNMVYIATAAHCLKNAHTEVLFADGFRYPAVIAYKNPAKDVGFLLVNQSDLRQGTLDSILPAVGADAQTIGKVQGDVLFAVSSADRPNALVAAGALDQYSVVYPNNPQQNVLQFYSEATYGSSGGGVYTLEGIWVGSVSGGDTFGKCWAVPYSDILSEFTGWLTVLAMQQAAAA